MAPLRKTAVTPSFFLHEILGSTEARKGNFKRGTERDLDPHPSVVIKRDFTGDTHKENEMLNSTTRYSVALFAFRRCALWFV
jgi:hypothetical protein